MCSNVDRGIAFCGNIVIRDSCIVIDDTDQKICGTVTDLTCSMNTARNQATLSWKKVKGISGYEVQYSTTDHFSGKSTKQLGKEQTSYALQDLPKER